MSVPEDMNSFVRVHKKVAIRHMQVIEVVGLKDRVKLSIVVFLGL